MPIPGPEHKEILSFLNEAGCIHNFTAEGLPVYNELYLCHAPEERLFTHGVWQNGIIPQLGNSKNDNDELERFHKLMEGYKNAVDASGKPLFALPVDDSAFTPETIALDNISFVDFLKQQGFTSDKVFWYANYCCRDDYGTESAKTSAFAGIHYFAGRRGLAANAENGDVLTWPQGNGFLADKLQQHTKGNIKTNALVYRVEEGPDNMCHVYYNKAGTDATVRIIARKVLMATPQFINKRLLSGRQLNYDAFSYAPWMVANLTLKNAPLDRSDNRPLSWDNVLYKSDGLGYINSCHQHTKLHQKQVVLTYYKPLSTGEPAQMRQQAHAKDIAAFQQEIIADLKRAHPHIEEEIENLDVWLWGHAMARPTLGFITGNERKQAKQTINGTIYFAHSDLGLPVFEEAFTKATVLPKKW
ncbi:MAG: FAD-dependent oxidoreductase [Sphingobacteriales bacterium JAD_PAG50586_3]|nr:MAG: FAD-dependent oxidoreductase [Sphingobacteriales bacterium JAD_PAG50586_3]